MLFLQNKSNLPPVGPGDPPALPTPFVDYEPNWQTLEKLAAKYRHVDKIILAGQGGAINTFRGIYGALANRHTPPVIFVDTNDPEYLQSVRSGADAAKTLLVVVSKSGETLTALEALFYFYDLPNKAIVAGRNTPLHQIAHADNLDCLIHPELSGRYAGLSEISMFPALLCGFDAKGLRKALLPAPRERVTSNAWQLANALWRLEQDGQDILVISNYVRPLKDFNLLIQQLLHETIAKSGLGLTVVPVDSPESHHHTMQRLFDGRRDLSLVFVNGDSQSLNISVPEKLQSLKIKERTLAVFDQTDLAHALSAEYVGASLRANELGLANATIHLEKVNAENVGEYIFFWQMLALHSAHLRGLNPFDQPAVEASKVISFKERFK